MITEDYVSFEIAKLLKEKGFNEECKYFYDEYDGNKYVICSNGGSAYNDDKYPTYYSMPTLQMVIKWLRKNYQIFIRPNISFLYPIKWYSEIFCYGDNLKTQQDIKTEYYDSPKQACEAAIKYCLENLI